MHNFGVPISMFNRSSKWYYAVVHRHRRIINAERERAHERARENCWTLPHTKRWTSIVANETDANKTNVQSKLPKAKRSNAKHGMKLFLASPCMAMCNHIFMANRTKTRYDLFIIVCNISDWFHCLINNYRIKWPLMVRYNTSTCYIISWHSSWSASVAHNAHNAHAHTWKC